MKVKDLIKYLEVIENKDTEVFCETQKNIFNIEEVRTRIFVDMLCPENNEVYHVIVINKRKISN